MITDETEPVRGWGVGHRVAPLPRPSGDDAGNPGYPKLFHRGRR